MIRIFATPEGTISRIDYSGGCSTAGSQALEVESIPDEPVCREGFGHELVVRDGALQWVSFKLEEHPEPEPPAPTHEEIESARAAAYRQTVDPITCEIQRLRDMGGTAEELSQAEARREAAVASIKEQHPYPEDEVSTVDSSRL